MPIPQNPQLNLPKRYAVEWTRGGSVDSRPVGSYVATSQNLTGLPTAPVMVGSDTSTFAMMMTSNLAANATQTLSQAVMFQGIPPQKPLPGYSLVAQTTFTVNHAIAGLNIASSTFITTGRTTSVGQVAGPVFAAGNNYLGWGGYATVILTNSSGGAITAGTLYGTATVQLWLYNRDLSASSNVQGALGSDTLPVVGGSSTGGRTPSSGRQPGAGFGGNIPGGTRGPNRL